MTEKSVSTKSGPVAGERDAFPNSPDGGATKHVGLIHSSWPWRALPALQPATRLGRFQSFSFPPLENAAPELLMLSIRGAGNPERIFWIRVTWKLPSMALVTGFQFPPNCFPRPTGKS